MPPFSIVSLWRLGLGSMDDSGSVWPTSAPALRVAAFQKLCTEHKSLAPAANGAADPDADRKRAAAIVASAGPEVPSWPVLFELDGYLLKLLPLTALAAKVQNLRYDYTDVAGSARSVAYFGSLIDPKPGCDVDALRLQAVEMLSEVQRLRIARFGFTRMRNRLAVMAIIVAFGTVLSLLGLIMLSERLSHLWGSHPATALVSLALVGMLGGSISSVSRLFGLAWSAELAGTIDDLRSTYRGLLLNVILSMLQGCVFALALYAIFAGGFVQGSLFPQFRDSSDPVVLDNLFAYFERGPRSHPDFAKALVWAFAAGFSERLVPDFLNSLRVSASPTE
jgi:hypothetical protein